jgi:hypothetical protein
MNDAREVRILLYEICDLTPVKMSMFVFWVVTPCELVVHTSVSQEHTLSIFGAKDGNCPFPRNVRIYLQAQTA